MKNEKHDKKAAVFWDEKDESTRKEIAKVLSSFLNVPVSSFLVEVDFDGLPVLQKKILENYYEQHIFPQEKKKGQQIRYDGIIEELLPIEMECPRCGSQAKRVITKRGTHIKCISCNFDSNQVFDFSKDRRRGYVFECMKLLKDMFPLFNFAENMSYNPDIIFTWKPESFKTKYDIKVLWMGQKIARIRVELNRHLVKKRFYDADECYIIGRKEIVEYLNKRGALIVHYLIDEPDEKNKILMSRAREIIEYGTIKDDKFYNLQYFVPKEKRRLIVKSTKTDMNRLLTADLFTKLFYKDIRVL